MAVGDSGIPDPLALALLGEVAPPDPDVLERARETLWSVVAEEMLDLETPVRRLAEGRRGAVRPRSGSAEAE
jgi:hypothetical protein